METFTNAFLIGKLRTKKIFSNTLLIYVTYQMVRHEGLVTLGTVSFATDLLEWARKVWAVQRERENEL